MCHFMSASQFSRRYALDLRLNCRELTFPVKNPTPFLYSWSFKEKSTIASAFPTGYNIQKYLLYYLFYDARQ